MAGTQPIPPLVLPPEVLRPLLERLGTDWRTVVRFDFDRATGRLRVERIRMNASGFRQSDVMGEPLLERYEVVIG